MGKGATGSVYKYRNIEEDKIYAVKIMTTGEKGIYLNMIEEIIIL